MLKVHNKLSIPSSEFILSFSRSSGPGGQNVNKVSSKALLKWDIKNSTHLTDSVKKRFLEQNPSKVNKEGFFWVQSDRFRDQTKNQDDCFKKLRLLILEALKKPKIRRATKPSRGQVQKGIDSRKRKSEKKKSRAKISY